MIKDITAKTLLSSAKHPDPWFGIKYTMNLYRGCQHQCIYCDSRSECYRIEDFAEVQAKTNAIELLRRELAGKRVVGTIGFGSMHDPYMPAEAEVRLTRRALEVILEHRFPVHILTKGDLVTRDIDLLARINHVSAAVSFTVTTADDELARRLEPGAALPSARFRAMRKLAERGIPTGVTMMPVLPFIEDTEANVSNIVSRASESGARYVLPWFGMTLRDRQRAYYYDRLDRLFPGMRQRYEAAYGDRYSCPVPGAARLEVRFRQLCESVGLATRFPGPGGTPPSQTALFGQ